MANTPIYGWETPDDTDYVYQGAAAARTTANAIDATLAAQITTVNGSIATTNSNVAALPKGVLAYIRSTTETITPTTTATIFMTTNAPFTPVAGRLYKITVTVGYMEKRTSTGGIFLELRKGAGTTVLDTYAMYWDYFVGGSLTAAGTYSWSKIYTSAQLGTTSFTPYIYAYSNAGGAMLMNTSTLPGCIIVEDLGVA
jgi:hypothetical protein